MSTFRIRPEHIRQANYESILSGALIGMTYGANGIWQWHTDALPGTHSPRVTFDKAIHFPGSSQMTVLKQLMEDHDWYRMKPARSFLYGVSPSDRFLPMAKNDRYLMVYFPQGTQTAVLKPDLTVKRQSYVWINPQDGKRSRVHPIAEGYRILTDHPPDRSDWILVVTHEAIFKSTETFSNPTSIQLHQNYPNPFNPETLIRYDLPEPVHVSLIIYNTRGQQVRRLIDIHQEAGVHWVIWDGLNDTFQSAASGIYLYHIITDQRSDKRKMLLLK